MRHSLQELYAILRHAGIPEPGGFPIPAILTAIAYEEGADPDAYVAHDPPTDPTAAPSSGLYQIHRPDWPELFDATQQVRIGGLSQREKILRQTMIARPVLIDALETASKVTQILESRGLAASRLTSALVMDATWKSGRPHVLAWARSTKNGDARQIIDPSRARRIEAHLRLLAPHAMGMVPAEAAGFGVLALLLGLGLAIAATGSRR